jgi:hypothetical protein
MLFLLHEKLCCSDTNFNQCIQVVPVMNIVQLYYAVLHVEPDIALKYRGTRKRTLKSIFSLKLEPGGSAAPPPHLPVPPFRFFPQ